MPAGQNKQEGFAVKEGAAYSINQEGHCLHIVQKNISLSDIDAVSTGKIQLALYEDGPFLFVLCKIKDTAWVDVPFCWHKLAAEEKVYLEEGNIAPFEYTFRIVLSDPSLSAAATREFILDKEFAAKLHAVLFRQAQSLFNPHSFMKHLTAVYNNLDVSDMVNLAEAHFQTD